MKGLIKKILTPIAVSAAVLLPNSASAQEKIGEFKQKSYISLGIGNYNVSGQEMHDIYGSFPRFRAGFGRDMSEQFRLEGALAYSETQGEPYLFVYGDWDNVGSSSGIHMLHLEALAKYMIRGKSVDFSI